MGTEPPAVPDTWASRLMICVGTKGSNDVLPEDATLSVASSRDLGAHQAVERDGAAKRPVRTIPH